MSAASRDIDALLAHRPPFRFVDALVDISETDGELVLVLADDDPRLTPEGLLRPLLLVEALAQGTAAFHGAVGAAGAGGADGAAPVRESGLLVSIDSARFHATARAGDRVCLRVHRERQLGPLVRFTATAAVGGTVLVEATVTVRRDIARSESGDDHA